MIEGQGELSFPRGSGGRGGGRSREPPKVRASYCCNPPLSKLPLSECLILRTLLRNMLCCAPNSMRHYDLAPRVGGVLAEPQDEEHVL